MDNVQLMRYFGGYLSVYQRIVVKSYNNKKSKLQTSLSGAFKVATTPCYMLDATIVDIADGAMNVTKAVFDMIE